MHAPAVHVPDRYRKETVQRLSGEAVSATRYLDGEAGAVAGAGVGLGAGVGAVAAEQAAKSTSPTARQCGARRMRETIVVAFDWPLPEPPSIFAPRRKK